MNRAATCAALLLCAASFACKTVAPAPPPPPPPWPADCVEVHGSPVNLTVNKLASPPANRDCIVIDKDAEVAWNGDADVKTLVVGWKPGSSTCAPPPTVDPGCATKACNWKSSGFAYGKLPFCYGVAVTDGNGTSKFKDPRLIIQP